MASYGYVDPNKFASSNPADQNAMAISAGYTGKEDYLNNRNSSQPATGGGYSGGNISGSTYNADDLNKAIAASVAQYKTAVQPAIDTIQGQIDPLKSRYDSLLSSIKGQGEAAVNKQTAVTSGELAKRGILGSSTLAQQEIQNATQPVAQQWAGVQANTSLDETNALNSLAQAIAQLQSGAATQGITTGTDIYGKSIDANSALAAATAQAEQQKIANQIAQKQLENQTKQTTYEINKPYSTSGGGVDLSSLMSLLGGGSKSTGQWVNNNGQVWSDTTKYPVGTFTGKDGKTYTEYSDGSVGSTIWTFK